MALITGQIFDSANGQGIPGATISFGIQYPYVSVSATTDGTGHYTITLTPATYDGHAAYATDYPIRYLGVITITGDAVLNVGLTREETTTGGTNKWLIVGGIAGALVLLFALVRGRRRKR